MIAINARLLEKVVDKAKASPRKRMNYNFHTDLADTFQRMLNCIEPGSYCRPHKHESPDKREVFIILKGTVVVIEFDNDGNIVEKIVLNNSTGQFGVEIPPSTWHSILALESGTVVYECKDGPYSPLNDKDFAPWSPEEGSEEVENYYNGLLEKIATL
jgi:cupin fold WbuC family metalloprotein